MAISLKRATVFAEGLDHPECLAVHPDGSTWAGGEAGQIYRISPDGKTVEQIACTGGFILGLAISPDLGWLVACDLKKKCLWRLDLKTAKLTIFSKGIGKRYAFSTPNYASFSDDGTLYVSDSGTWEKTDGRILQFHLDHTGRGSVWHRGPFQFANGMALSPERDALFVVCSTLPGVEKITIEPDGKPGKRSVYARVPKTVPDGLAFDARGNLYMSCYSPSRIYKITPHRKISLFIEDPQHVMLASPTNIAFGGENFDQMFTANLGRWHLTKFKVGFKGLPLASHKQMRHAGKSKIKKI